MKNPRFAFLFLALALVALPAFGAPTEAVKKNVATGELIEGFKVPTGQVINFKDGSQIGFNTDSPVWEIDDQGAGTRGFRLFDTSGSIALIFQTANGVETGLSIISASGPLALYSNSAEAMRFDSSGANGALGQTTPAAGKFTTLQGTKLVIPITNLGTIAGAGTATLTNSASVYRAIFSGSTATIALPTTPADGKWVIHGNSTYSSGTQTITVPSLIRPESDLDTATTSFTVPATTSGYWTAEFTAINGAFVKFSVVGDSLASSTTDALAFHTTTSGEISGLTSKATPTTSDLAVIEDAAASNAKKKVTIDAILAANDARTKTQTNTTLDANATGNVLKWIEEIQLTHPHQADGTGATINTTATAATYGHATFSNSTDKATNYVIYRLAVPYDFDSATDLAASFVFRLGGADTGKHAYEISMADVNSSAGADSPTFSNAIALTFAGDASGASGDREIIAYTTLNSWKSSLTAGHILVIKLSRDGDDGTNDTSTVDSTDGVLKIKVGHSQ